jgi:hypothetical protein
MAHLHNIDAPGCLDEQRLAFNVLLFRRNSQKRARDLGWSEKRSQHTFCIISLAGEFRIAFLKPSVHVVLLPLSVDDTEVFACMEEFNVWSRN